MTYPMHEDAVLDLFPTTRERWRAAFHPPMPKVFTMEPPGFLGLDDSLDRWRAETKPLRRELESLDPVGGALLLEVRRYTYKPGTTFKVRRPPSLLGTHSLVVTMSMQDSRNPWKDSPLPPGREPNMTRVISPSQIPTYITEGLMPPEQREEIFSEWLRRTVTDVEIHEADEWIRRDGVMLFDPHAPERKHR